MKWVQGLTCDKLTHIELDIYDVDVNFMCFTEVWTNYCNFLNFRNFNLTSCFYRKLHIRGGVAIWAKEGLDVTPINLESFCREMDIEVCGVIWQFSDKKIIIITCYRPPNGDFIVFVDVLFDLLRFVHGNHVYIVLTGDFNLHFEKNDKKTKIFLDLLLTFDVHSLVDEPTRKNAILDNVFVNFDNAECGVFPCIVSDHNYIVFNSNIEVKATTIPSVFKKNVRIFREDGVQSLLNALIDTDWPDFHTFDTFDEAFNYFYDKYNWVTTEVKTSSYNLHNLYYLQL